MTWRFHLTRTENEKKGPAKDRSSASAHGKASVTISVIGHDHLYPPFERTFEQLKDLLSTMKKEQNFHFIIDLVDNHAANDCSVSKDHPESAYNLLHSPHLKPAVLLDSILMQFTEDCQAEKLLAKGIPPQIREHHLQLIRHDLFDEVLPSSRRIGWSRNSVSIY